MVDPVALGRAHRLLPGSQPRRGTPGQRFGRGAGSSLEFQELRDYQVGDDLRHVDWRSYARTEQLHTRMYREEVAATFELILDGSRSMALTPAKRDATRWVCAFLAAAAEPDFALRAVLATDPPRPLPVEVLAQQDLPGVDFDGRQPLDSLPLQGVLRPGSVRVVVSDFLFPHDAPALVDRLGRGAGALLLVAVLDAEERDPGLHGSVILHEVETGARRELSVDERLLNRYRERLARLWAGLDREARVRGALAVQLDAEAAPEVLVADGLVRTGVVEPR